MNRNIIAVKLVAIIGMAMADESPEARFSAMTPEQVRAFEADLARRVADLALIPPTLNTRPLPRYDYDRLDYGMTIGIERTPKGRLWACWVAGGDSPKAFFVLATSDDDGETWSKPRLVVDSHSPSIPGDRSILVGNLWTDPLGRLWLIFDQSMDMFDGRAGVWASVCDNPDALTPAWSAPRRIWHGVTLNKPTVLSSGEWMLPISLDQREGFGMFKGLFRELDPLRGANVFVSADKGATWQRRGAVRFPEPDWHEHMIIERKDKSLWMLARTRTGIMQSTSVDGGRTWASPTEPEGIRQPNARFHVRRLSSGRLLLVKHGEKVNSHSGRVGLSAWLSDDEGKTWQGGLLLDERKGVSYPDGFQAPDGTIYISYDRNRATDGEILMARFTESDVRAGKMSGPKSKLKMLVSRPLAPRKPVLSAAIENHGNLWNDAAPFPKAADLPQVAGAEFHVIKRKRPDVDGCKWTLGVGLCWHKEKLYASYGFNQGEENTASEEAHARVSEDGGKTWGKPVVMDAGDGDLGVSHGVFLSHAGRLWAFMGAFHGDFQRTHTRAYRLDESSGRWEARGVVLDKGFWPMQEPRMMADGNWIMAGFRVSKGHGVRGGELPAVAISRGDDFTKWDMTVINTDPALGTNIWGESTVIVDKNRITNIARYGQKAVALVSTSNDFGRTWSEAKASNMPMTTSKPYAGTLRNGQRFLVCTTTADTGGRRSPLTIAVSKAGEPVFSKVFLIRNSVSDRTSGVSAPNADFSYPYAVEHAGKLYIGYTHKSHAANELAVIPVDALKIE
ncbi:MAG: exo-alpha-sialidase [Planctomycetota bacterium]